MTKWLPLRRRSRRKNRRSAFDSIGMAGTACGAARIEQPLNAKTTPSPRRFWATFRYSAGAEIPGAGHPPASEKTDRNRSCKMVKILVVDDSPVERRRAGGGFGTELDRDRAS